MEDSLSKKLAVLQDISDDDLLDNIEHSRIFCASLLSSMVLTLCDHVVTFEDEVHQVWRHRQNIVTIGFFLARYLTLFSRSFDLFIHMYSRWSATSCNTIMKLQLPGIFTLVTIIIVHLVMILRVYALYGGNAIVLVVPGLIMVAEIIMMGLPLYLLGRTSYGGLLVQLYSSDVECVMVRSEATQLANVYWVTPVLQDTAIFALTLWRSRRYAKSSKRSYLVKVFLRDGIIYYLVIGIFHALNWVLFVIAPQELKAVATGFTQSVSTILMSRLVLSLRKSSSRLQLAEVNEPTRTIVGTNGSGRPTLTSLAAIVAFFDAGGED